MNKLVVVLAALPLWSCADEPLPVCPTGDCTLPARATARWQFNNYPERMFPGDTCQDLGVTTVRAEAYGIDDPAVYETKDIECGQGQVSFLGLASGNYEIAITPLDGAGEALVHAPGIVPITVGVPGSDTMVTVPVPFESWVPTYTGTLLFRLAWAGASCETATPAVAMQTLTLMVNGGSVATALTDTGQRLDGTDPQACRPNTASFAQFAEGLPWGPATLLVTGTDGTGMLAFEHTFETFVGAAKNNPTIMFDVTALPPPMPMP